MAFGKNHGQGFQSIGEIFSHEDYLKRLYFEDLKNDNCDNGLCLRGYTNVDGVVSSIEIEEGMSVVDKI